uniref:Uncharacterized protein n=1 Tax=Arundo donax TaxID=35708 RepID=A0A0A9GDL3_ARUDO
MKCQEYVAADDISFVLISFNSMTQTMCSKLCSPYTATAIGSLDTTMTTTCLALGTNDGANNVQHVRAVTGVLITSTGGSLAPSVKSVSATKFNRKVCAKCSMECLSEDSVAISVTDMSWLPAAEMALIPGQRYCHHNSHLRGGVTRPPPHPPWATSIFCCKTWSLYRTLAGRQPGLNVCSTKVWLLLSSWSPSTHQYKVK